MAIPAMALLQQHGARRDILIEPAARRRAAIEARGHSELGALGTGGAIGRKNQPACLVKCQFKETTKWTINRINVSTNLVRAYLSF